MTVLCCCCCCCFFACLFFWCRWSELGLANTNGMGHFLGIRTKVLVGIGLGAIWKIQLSDKMATSILLYRRLNLLAWFVTFILQCLLMNSMGSPGCISSCINSYHTRSLYHKCFFMGRSGMGHHTLCNWSKVSTQEGKSTGEYSVKQRCRPKREKAPESIQQLQHSGLWPGAM